MIRYFYYNGNNKDYYHTLLYFTNFLVQKNIGKENAQKFIYIEDRFLNIMDTIVKSELKDKVVKFSNKKVNSEFILI